jgi:hypothetical protein
MPFSAEQFAKIIEALQASPRPAKQDEQHRAPRTARDVRLSITPILDGVAQPGYDAQVENLSSRGLGLLDANKLRTGAQFTITLPHENGQPVTLLCTVVHCRPAGKKLFRIGAEFTCVLPESPVPLSDDQDRIRASILD